MTDQTEDTDEQVSRDFAKALFAHDDEPDEHKPPIPNFVPKEGNIPNKPDSDQDMREFTRNLFDRDPN